MTEAINKIPAETRWEIAAKGLTGAIVAMEKAHYGKQCSVWIYVSFQKTI